MSCLFYHDTELYIENVSLRTIAEKYGTPCYIYSQAALEKNWNAFKNAFQAIPHQICYAVKANSNIAILRLLAQLNAGFDIVSCGELERVLVAGGDPNQIIFSGVGKKEIEIEQAIKAGIYCFNVESEPELYRLQNSASQLNKKINIALRINPNVEAGTHTYISTGLTENKFGIEMEAILPLCQKLSSLPALQLIGIACHIGSQIIELNPFLIALERLLTLYEELRDIGITIHHINMGGGLGITYHNEKPPSIHAYAHILQKKCAAYPLKLIVEPGRAIVGNAGILLTQIEYLKETKQKNFAIVDAGMNDLIRPALYQAWQAILPVKLHATEKKRYDIAGPVCESADFFGKDRELALCSGDLLAIDSAGAYGFSMSSNYNSRCRAAEILVHDDECSVIRRRETFHDLFAAEN